MKELLLYCAPEAYEIDMELLGLLCESPFDSDTELIDLEGPEL